MINSTIKKDVKRRLRKLRLLKEKYAHVIHVNRKARQLFKSKAKEFLRDDRTQHLSKYLPPDLDEDLKSEQSCYGKLANILETSEQPADITKNIVKDFLVKRAGMVIVPKIEALIDHILERAEKKQLIRVVIRACRGGGKTYSIAHIEFSLFHFFDFDFVNLGGSKAQAQKAYKVIKDLCNIPEIKKTIKSSIQSYTEKKNGTWLSVLATSTTQVRSPHPGSRHKGGGLFIDEECEIKDAEIVKSAKPIVNVAHPSAIIRASTQHKLNDTFEEVWDNAKEQGYTRFDWDAFDVCKKCPRSCDISIEEDPDNGCYDELRQDVLDSSGNVIKKGYCKGRAHHDGYIYQNKLDGSFTKTYVKEDDWKDKTDGWMTIEEIFQAFQENDIETFEVEYLGRKRSRKGKVYDPALLQRSELHDFQLDKKQFRRLDKAIGIDWGFGNMTVVVYAFRYGKYIYIYWIDVYQHTSIGRIKQDVEQRVINDNIETSYNDSEGAFENAEIAEFMQVKSVSFNTWKDFGVGNVRNFLEKDKLRVLKNFNGLPNPGFKIWSEQMKGYKFDEHGNYVKKNDHAPDATFLSLLKWAPVKKKKNMNKDEAEPRLMLV